jgi:hypothetical protein
MTLLILNEHTISLVRTRGVSERNLRAKVMAVARVSSPGIIITMMFWQILSNARLELGFELDNSPLLSLKSASSTH